MASAAPGRRSYAQRMAALADLINTIAPDRHDPHVLHERRDAAAREARALALALAADSL